MSWGAAGRASGAILLSPASGVATAASPHYNQLTTSGAASWCAQSAVSKCRRASYGRDAEHVRPSLRGRVGRQDSAGRDQHDRQAKSPIPVFLGALLALGLVTFIGVAFGEALTRLVPTNVLKRISAVFFVLMGVLIWFDVF